jgi:Family of unknown function (DUF5686)/CarboxypepD_reg-like domain
MRGIFKNMLLRVIFIGVLVGLNSVLVQAQQTVVFGKVKDAETGDPVPFANVVFKGTQIGTTTSFEGEFTLSTTARYDTIIISYVGYEIKEIPIIIGQKQEINVQILQNVIRLKELVVYPGENPAFEIMRRVVANKKKNDKRQLDAYQYESYTKIEVDIDNMSDRFRSKKVVQKATAVLDSIQTIAGENGKPILPIFFSEAISNYYVKNNPFLRHEYIIKTSVTGIGLTDGTTTSQVIGATFQEYNFYRNFLTILEKEFASPIANSWKGIYEYDLIDSVYVGDDFCYRIDFFPKRKHDLAFNGTIWITRDGYALKQVDAAVGRSSNLNFVEKLRIQQELMRTDAGPWLPKKTRVLVDLAQPSVDMAGLLAKFYTSIDKIVINEPQDDSFYRMPVEMDEEIRQSDDKYWANMRHEELSQAEINVYHMVDTLKRIPVIKAYSDVVKLAYSGFYKWGKVDIGPYPLFLSFNDVEGVRLGIGGETNYDFSKRFVFKGYAGYGLHDQRWKYSLGMDYVASRKPWLKFGGSVGREVDPVYFLFVPIEGQVAFYAFTRLGVLRRPFVHDKYELHLENQLIRDVNLRLALRNDYLQPLFDFQYYSDLSLDPSSIQENLTSTEIKVELEWAKDRKYLINDNYRYSSGYNRFPVITLRYTAGLKGVLGSDFAYNKVGLKIVKRFKLGQFGTSTLRLDGEYIFGTVPFPLLENHLGNETPFYSPQAFSLMDNFEFTSDHYASATYRHHFNGLIMNRVPLLKFLKLRLYGEARVLIGGVRQSNIDIIVPIYDDNGIEIPQFKSLDDQPYIELGYGIENILKIIQINFIHRITTFDAVDSRRFGVKIGFQFTL